MLSIGRRAVLFCMKVLYGAVLIEDGKERTVSKFGLEMVMNKFFACKKGCLQRNQISGLFQTRQQNIKTV